MSGPKSAAAGSTIAVSWTGPDLRDDRIQLARKGAKVKEYEIHSVYTKDGNPVTLMLPKKSGDYELRYYFRQTRSILAAQPIKVIEGLQ